MQDCEAQQKVLQIVARVSKRELATISPQCQLVADLGGDSPKALELLCDLEEELKIEIPEDAVSNIQTVGDLLALNPQPQVARAPAE